MHRFLVSHLTVRFVHAAPWRGLSREGFVRPPPSLVPLPDPGPGSAVDGRDGSPGDLLCCRQAGQLGTAGPPEKKHRLKRLKQETSAKMPHL